MDNVVYGKTMEKVRSRIDTRLASELRTTDRAPKKVIHPIYHSYPTIMRFGSYILPKEDPKNI